MKVIDLSCDIAGRFAAKLLAMSGWDVIRPEIRLSEYDADEERLLACYLDADKTTTTWEEVIQTADYLDDVDVVFTSYDAGKYQGYASQELALPESCIHITTSPFGTTGPYSKYRGGTIADWAAGGYLAITGDPDKEPLMGPAHLCSYVAGYFSAVAVEAAYRQRENQGNSQCLDISVMESMLCVHQSTFSRLGAGIVRDRTGRYAEVYPLTILPCRDGYVSLGVVADIEFDRLAIAIGQPELTVDERFSTVMARSQHRDELDAELNRFLLACDVNQVVDLLQKNGVAATKVVDTSEILTNPQLDYRMYWKRESGPLKRKMPGNPIPVSNRFTVQKEKYKQENRDYSSKSEKQLPLSGVVVLDFTAFWAGPSATRLLADLGAEVIWIERPKSRVDANLENLDPASAVQYLYHCKMNRNKKSVVLDMETEHGRQEARRLAISAHVVVENYRPGVADRLGIGPKDLCKLNPLLIYISLSGFGATGPWRDWRSFGPNLEAASSIMSRIGYRDGEPMRLGHALPDGVGGIVGALAALRGLRERDAESVGGWFDISQLEAFTAISGEEILATYEGQSSSVRNGNRSSSALIQGVFRCKGEDNWLALRLNNSVELRRLAELAGLSKIVDSVGEFQKDDNEIENLIGCYTKDKDKYTLFLKFQKAGLICFPVLKADELARNKHLAERDFFVKMTLFNKVFVLPGTPIKAQESFVDTSGAAPKFGEHTSTVLSAF